MAKVEFATGESYNSSWGMYGTAEYTPVYVIIDGTKKFLRNLCRPLTGESDVWRKYEEKKSAADVEKAKETLMKNEGKYFAIHAQFDDPFEFLNWVKENDYTLEVVESFFRYGNCDFTDFHGNACEYSCAFHYRIYDETMLEEIKTIVSGMKQHIR